MENWNKKLITAVQDGDLEAVKVSLQNAADIDYQNEESSTALMLASKCGRLDVTRLLLDNKCKKETAGAFGYTALMLAASEGHLDVTKLLLDSGCEKETTDNDGYTVLILAASVGNRDMIQLLLDSGCKKETKSTIGYTALMLAASEGRIEVTKMLVDSGFETKTTNKDGRTALHLAAMRGHLQVTRYFVEGGLISPFVRTHQSETPYDLAASKLMDDPHKYQGNKQVMEYLKHVMTQSPFNIIPPMSGNIQETPFTEDVVVPSEIKSMTDTKSVPLYLKLLESGSEKKKDIRLLVVGKKGAGKTSLIKRLFGEDNTGVTSTNGIEIHAIQCKAMSNDGIWKKIDGNNEENEIHARLLKHYKETMEASKEEEDHNAIQDNTRITILYIRTEESKESEASLQEPRLMKPYVTTKTQLEPQTNQSLEKAKRDLETMLESNVDLHDKEEYATLFLWDFAGDEEFYHTHQTFFSPDAIYLVVTKLNEVDDKKALDLFQLWMDSIHCYSRPEEDKNKSDTNQKKSEYRDPPVIIVGTWTDALISGEEKIEDACKHNILMYTENMSEDELCHIRQEYFISNTKDDPSVFKQIRENILNLARTMNTWNRDYPLKFIQLEKQLQKKKKELPIISFQEMQQIASVTTNPLDEEELKLFLKFHHEIRALVYFKDIPDYIILDTQWLSDAFRCIVTAKKFQHISTRNRIKWDELYSTGKLHDVVLEDIFRKLDKSFSKHKDHILNVMEKFDIIIRPYIPESADENPCYFVPCLVKTEYQCDIFKMLNVTGDTCRRSTWLCFKFIFQPPHIINHLIAALNRIYGFSEVFVPNQKKKPVALFRGAAVFEVQKETKLRKLLVMTFSKCIQVQVLEFGKSIKRGMYGDIGVFVTEELKKIIHTRFKMSTVEFEKKWECGLTKPELVTGSNEFSKEHITEYFCGTCAVTHTYLGEWSKQENQPLSDRYEKKEGQIGLVVIVNFMFRGEAMERQGSEIDVTKLKDFFTKIGYEVKCAPEDMTKEELQNFLLNIEKSYLTVNSKKYYCFICVIMSHGHEDTIKTKDKKTITVEEIKKVFKNKSDGKFNGKPKLFLIQACRGTQEQYQVVVSEGIQIGNIERQSQSENYQKLISNVPSERNDPSVSSEVLSPDAYGYLSNNTPIDADIIVQYATTPGFMSFRHIHAGSYFIKAFLSVAEKKYRDEHLEEILTQVRNKLATDPEFAPQSGNFTGKCQMAILESTSTKKFFL